MRIEEKEKNPLMGKYALKTTCHVIVVCHILRGGSEINVSTTVA